MTEPDNKNSFIKYEQIEHLSDVMIKIYGKTMKELFEHAAEGMFSLITNLDNVKKTIEEEIIINIKGKIEPEDFLIAWLEKLLYLCEVEGIVFSYFNIKKFNNNGRQNSISALVKGEKINIKKHEIIVQIKAPTYHNLNILREHKTGLYIVEITFDV
jgi:SHS2 domain-containing protein